MAFHPYPGLIPSVFNRSGSGPPRGLTPASAWPGVAHPASRARRATLSPCSGSLSLRLGHPLTSPRGAARWLILQKARRHPAKGAPAARGRTVSGAVSLPSRGAFHLSLTVLVRYRSRESVQPWGAVPPASRRVSRARRYSGPPTRPGRVRVRGSHPVPPAFPGRSAPSPVCHRAAGLRPRLSAPNNPGAATPAGCARAPVWARPVPLAATPGISVDFSSSGYLDVSVPPVAPRPRAGAGA